MSNLGAIITVVLVVWAIISGIVGAAAKRKEQERLAELARRRRAQAQQMVGQQTGEQSVAVRGPAKQASAHQVRVEELRRRREQQLAELRQQGQRSRPPAQARIGSARIAPRGAAPPTAPPRRIQPAPTFRPAPTTRRAPTSPPQRVPPPRQPERIRAEVARPVDHAEHVGSLELETSKTRTASDGLESRRSRRARVKLGGRSSLRRAIILKEILDRPLALRSEGVGEIPF